MRARKTSIDHRPRRRRRERLWTIAVVISCVCAIAVASSAWVNRERELNNAETIAFNAEQLEIYRVHHELALSFVAEYETALFVDADVLPASDLEAATSLRRSTVARLEPDLLRLSRSEDAYIVAVSNELLTIIAEYGDRSINTVADRFFIEAKTEELVSSLFQAVETAGPKLRGLRDLSLTTLRFGPAVAEVSVLGSVKDDPESLTPLIDLVGGRYKNTVSRLDAAPGFSGDRELFELDLDPATLDLFDELDRSGTVESLDMVYRWWRERALAGDAPLQPEKVAPGITSFNALESVFFDEAVHIERGNLAHGGAAAHDAANRQLFIGIAALGLAIANLLATLIVRFGREDRLRIEIESDPLTGLGSRALFGELDVRLGDDHVHPRALLHIDLDHFKPVNDVYGHQVGDALLVEVGAILRAGVRGAFDQILRVGGDEFVIALYDLDSVDEAELIARRLIDEIGQPFAIEGHEIVVSASVGIATSLRASSLDSMLTEADLALYEAKNGGRSQVVVFERSAQRELVQDLPRRIRRRDFELETARHHNLSPSASISDPDGVDVVLGWSDTACNRVSTTELLAMVEWSGQNRDFLDCQLEAAHQQQLKRPGTTVWVTPPNGLLRSERAAHCFLSNVRAAGIDPTRFGVVVRDLGRPEGIETASATLNALRANGIGLALGDFGMNHAPLRALAELPFDQVRVDADLVRSADDSPTKAVLVAAITDVCASLGIDAVVAGTAPAETHPGLVREPSA